MDVISWIEHHVDKTKPLFEGSRLHFVNYNSHCSWDGKTQDSIWLFHGTPFDSQTMILKNGFKLGDSKGVFLSNLIGQSVYYYWRHGRFLDIESHHEVLLCEVNLKDANQRHNSPLYQKDYVTNLCETRTFQGGCEYRICDPRRIKVLGVVILKTCIKDMYQKLVDQIRGQQKTIEDVFKMIQPEDKMLVFGWHPIAIQNTKVELRSGFVKRYEDLLKTKGFCSECKKHSLNTP